MSLVDVITWKSCIYEVSANTTIVLTDNKCADVTAKAECTSSGGLCRTDIDGYYIEVALNVVYGVIWFQWGKKVLNNLQNLDINEWRVLSNKSNAARPEETPLEDIKALKL